MDFGIGAACLTGLRVYSHASRRSGRTEATLKRLPNNALLIVASAQEARRIEQRLRELNRTDVRVAVPERPTAHGVHDAVLSRGSRHRQSVLDHSVVEAIYQRALEDVARDLKELADVTKLEDHNGEVPPVAYLAQGGL